MFGVSTPPSPKKPEPEPDPVQAEELDEAQNIVAWRYLMLLDLGISPTDALELVAIPHLDWHSAERLIRKGCPPGQVLGILA